MIMICRLRTSGEIGEFKLRTGCGLARVQERAWRLGLDVSVKPTSSSITSPTAWITTNCDHPYPYKARKEKKKSCEKKGWSKQRPPSTARLELFVTTQSQSEFRRRSVTLFCILQLIASLSLSMDPLQALAAALSVPADSKEQADLLVALRETLEVQPHLVPTLCNTLLKTAAGSNDSLFRRWVLELLHFGIARAPLAVDVRASRASLLPSPPSLTRPQLMSFFSQFVWRVCAFPPFFFFSRGAVSGRAYWSFERRQQCLDC